MIVHWKTVRRALKKLGASHRRACRTPAKEPEPHHVTRFTKALEKARLLAEGGAIDIVHGDESGFCLMPSLPYLWQKKGQTVGIASQAHNQRLNVLGFLREAGVEAAQVVYRLARGRLLSQDVIEVVEEQLLPSLVRPTVLLLDNAGLHRSTAVKERLRAWKAAGLHVWFLPPYCPHLNRIENLWKQCEYHWLQPENYQDFSTLCAAVSHALRHFNQKIPHYLCPTT